MAEVLDGEDHAAVLVVIRHVGGKAGMQLNAVEMDVRQEVDVEDVLR